MTTKYIVNNLSGQTITNEPILRPYKVYTALLTQTGINPPVATVLENTLGFIPTYSYNGTGNYSINSSSGFTSDKTVVFITSESTDIIYSTQVSSSEIIIGGVSDDLMSKTSIEIRVYL
jgi:hypothetical protein